MQVLYIMAFVTLIILHHALMGSVMEDGENGENGGLVMLLVEDQAEGRGK